MQVKNIIDHINLHIRSNCDAPDCRVETHSSFCGTEYICTLDNDYILLPLPHQRNSDTQIIIGIGESEKEAVRNFTVQVMQGDMKVYKARNAMDQIINALNGNGFYDIQSIRMLDFWRDKVSDIYNLPMVPHEITQSADNKPPQPAKGTTRISAHEKLRRLTAYFNEHGFDPGDLLHKPSETGLTGTFAFASNILVVGVKKDSNTLKTPIMTHFPGNSSNMALYKYGQALSSYDWIEVMPVREDFEISLLEIAEQYEASRAFASSSDKTKIVPPLSHLEEYAIGERKYLPPFKGLDGV